MTDSVPGLLALVGGNEWREGCSFDRDIVDSKAGAPVVVLPTAAAFEGPEGAIRTATNWFGGLGAVVEPCRLLTRNDASDPKFVDQLASAEIIYIGGGSAMHLWSVLRDSPAWDAMQTAWHGGATIAASSAGAMVLADPMIDPRGGAFTIGLGLLTGIAVLAHANSWSSERMRRTQKLAGATVSLLAIDECTAAIREPSGLWRVAGVGTAVLHRTSDAAPQLPGIAEK
jgi:cyanophycinase